jgi:hypothetical protein
MASNREGAFTMGSTEMGDAVLGGATAIAACRAGNAAVALSAARLIGRFPIVLRSV